MSKNRVFFHNKVNIKNIVISYLLCLIPLILYGIYKNGILLYTRDLISFLSIFKIIYLLIISLLIYILVDILIFKKKEIWTLDLLFLMIIPLFMPQNINLFVYGISLFISFLISNVLERKIKFNKMAFCKLFIILVLVVINNYTYLNPAENLNIYSLNYWDLLWGRNIGGIASTNIILGIIILILFSVLNNYKKIIAICSISAFIIISLLVSGFDINSLLSSSAILGLILLNVDSISTPHSRLGMIIYGIACGILTAILTYFLNAFEGVFISVLFLSFFTPILDKIVLNIS